MCVCVLQASQESTAQRRREEHQKSFIPPKEEEGKGAWQGEGPTRKRRRTVTPGGGEGEGGEGEAVDVEGLKRKVSSAMKVCRSVCVYTLGLASLLWTPLGQENVSSLERCLYSRG